MAEVLLTTENVSFPFQKDCYPLLTCVWDESFIFPCLSKVHLELRNQVRTQGWSRDTSTFQQVGHRRLPEISWIHKRSLWLWDLAFICSPVVLAAKRSGIGDGGWLLALVCFVIPYQMAKGDFLKSLFFYFLFLFPYCGKSDCFKPSATLWESFLDSIFGSPFHLDLYISVQSHSLSATFPLLPILCFGGVWVNPNISTDCEKRKTGPSAALTFSVIMNPELIFSIG